jgi:hypothetical protein
MVNGPHGDSASNRPLPISLLINLLPINLRIIRLILHPCNLLPINHPITLHLRNLQVTLVALTMGVEAKVTTTTAPMITHHQTHQIVYMVIGKTGTSAHNLAVVVPKLVLEV